MIVHNFDPILVDLGIFEVRWYSAAYILGIIIGGRLGYVLIYNPTYISLKSILPLSTITFFIA